MPRLTNSLFLAAICLPSLSSPTPTRPQDPRPQERSAPRTAADTELADLSWITGRWRKTDAGQVLEEHWGEPLGNSMTGTFRWLKKGVGWVYEFLLIEKTDKGITFYLRHLGPGSVAWEPVNKPLDFPLKSAGTREVIFEHPTRKKMKRLVYRRTKENRLIVRVEGIGQDGETAVSEFRFERR